MNFIEGNKYESDFGALTTNKQGKAITYDNYYVKFKKVIKDFISELLDSTEIKFKNLSFS